MDEFINVSLVFVNYNSRYVATFCDMKKITKCSLY